MDKDTRFNMRVPSQWLEDLREAASKIEGLSMNDLVMWVVRDYLNNPTNITIHTTQRGRPKKKKDDK